MQISHFQFNPETDRLGDGPLSEVYKAIDMDLGRTVALKILRAHAEIDPQADTRFKREAVHTAGLVHPNIATIYEFGKDQGTSFIAMEYLQGKTLDRVIKDQSLGYEECLRIAIQVTDALKSVHQHQLIHRDLKPGNIHLQDDGSVKLLDFGIARARDEASITQHGMLVGTVLYMSPEQVRGDRLDYRSDIFSLGAVLYHVMTGTLPFPGESFPEVCMAILEGRPRHLPSEVRIGFPKQLEEFLMRCMEAEPERRFSDAAEALSVLVSINSDLTGTNAHQSVTLAGTLALLPVRCGGKNPEACHTMAGGVRKDLEAELARNKALEVIAVEAAPPGSGFDYVVDLELSAENDVGLLQVQTEIREGKASGSIFKDTCEQEDANEWSLQEDLVRDAYRVIRKRLTTHEVRPQPAVNRKVKEASALARKASELLHRSTSKHLTQAIVRLRRAVELDRYCAIAYAGMGEAMVRKYLYWDGDPLFLEDAREHTGRALALDPDCAEAHTALGFANHLSGHSLDAQREYRLALQVDDNQWLAHRLLGALLAREGNFKNASPHLQRAIGIKPEHIDSYDHLYQVLQRLDRSEEALEFADQGISIAKRHLASTEDDQGARLHLAMLQARMGLASDARAQVEIARNQSPKDGYTLFHIACVYALLGEPSESMEALVLAQKRGYYMKYELVRNADLDILRSLPAFDQLTQ